MIRLLVLVLLTCLPGLASASTGGPALKKAHIDIHNKASLQRGARIFVNYCLSCHSAAYMRYNRMASDLGISEAQLEDNLMFAADKPGATMQVAMRATDATKWFDISPPDLSVIARSRGADWLYSFLLSFYVDASRPTGVNNVYFEDVAMPHVLWELQGLQALKPDGAQGEDSHSGSAQFEIVMKGSQSPKEYQKTVHDLVSFLVYMGDPARLKRERIGPWVLVFLVFFLGLSYLLKREYWKDVH